MKAVPTIIEFITDGQLLDQTISAAQETLLRAIYALPMTDEQKEIFRLCTGREGPPTEEIGEVTALCGARSGKGSRIAAPIASYESCFGGHDRQLAHGETGVVSVSAQDHRASGIVFNYIKSHFERSPILRNMMADEPRQQSIDLVNGIRVQCFPCTTGSMRGWSIPVGIMDEVGFYRLEGSANSDAEIQQSLRRGMVAFPRTKLIKISTPYMKSGVLFDDFTRAFGKPDPDILVWRAATQLMNPSIAPGRLERERRLDPQRYQREYEAEFAEDVAVFVPREWIDAAVQGGRFELPSSGRRAVAAIDPSGGGPDAFTLAIVYLGPGDTVVQAVMKGQARQGSTAPNLEALVEEYTTTAKRYGCTEVVSDAYAREWVQQAFERHRIRFRRSEFSRSEAYLNLEPLLAQGRIELLDHPQMIRELGMLERKPSPGGRDVVNHPRGGHDDHINALALAATYATVMEPERTAAVIYPGGGVYPPDQMWRRQYFPDPRASRRRSLIDGLATAPRPERPSQALLDARAEDRAALDAEARLARETAQHVARLKADEAERQRVQNDVELTAALASMPPELRARARKKFGLPKEPGDE